MPNDSIESRVDELEVRLSFQETTIAALDSVVRTQQAEIDALRRQLEKLQKQILTNPDGVEGAHIKPPHY